MDDIANELELSKTTLYLYFKNKQSLFFAVVVEGMKILSTELEKVINKGKNGLSQILSMTEVFFDYMTSNNEYYKLNLASRSHRFQVMIQQGEIENTTEYLELVQKLFSIIENAFKLGLSDSSIRSDIDPTKTTMFLGSAIERSVLPPPEFDYFFKNGLMTKKEYFEHSINLLLQGISSKKS